MRALHISFYVNRMILTHKECEPTWHSLACRFWNTCVRKEWNQLTPAGIYVSWSHIGKSSINATAGEAAFQTSHPYTLNFPDSQAGQSLIALLNVASLSQLTGQRYEIKLKVARKRTKKSPKHQRRCYGGDCVNRYLGQDYSSESKKSALL